MKSKIECQFKGHEGNQPNRICIFDECNQYKRWVCAECVVDDLHQHGQNTKDHLKRQQEFLIFIQQQQQSYSHRVNQQLELIKQELVKLKTNIDACKFQFERLQQTYISIKQNNKNDFKRLITQVNDDFQSIEQEQIEKLIKINKNASVLMDNDHMNGMQVPLNQNQVPQQIIKNNIIDLKQDQRENNQLSQFNYQNYFFSKENYDINTFEISPNEQMIAFGGDNKQLTIMNINTKQKMQELKHDTYVTKCQFSNDSNLIYFCNYEGWLYCLDILKDFRQIYKNKVHDYCINDIKIINNHQVFTCSQDKCLVLTDIKNKTQLIKISNAHQDDINSIEYDPDNQTLISCSDDKSIKLFSMNGNLLIDQLNAHNNQIFQIQLINNQNLMSRTEKELKLWEIDYKRIQLKQIRLFVEQDKLFNFQYSQKNSKLIKVYSNYLLILDSNYSVIQKKEHNVKDFWIHGYQNLPSSMNYLLILGKKEIQVLK